jgi:hypothetical protein
MLNFRLAAATGLVAVSLSFSAVGQERHLYWGDLHLHTNYSLDAYGVGNTYMTPDDAYRFARGIPVYHKTLDTKVQIDRPLDFLAVTDHSDSLGIDALVSSGDPLMEKTEVGRAMLAAAKDGPWRGVQGFSRANPALNVMEKLATPEVRGSTWQKEVDAAEKNNIPGTFTTLFAWEWTAMISGKNLHRNVISNANAEQAGQFVPYAAGQFYSVKGVDSNRPEDLWAWLDATAKRVGIDFIAIPHNSNISGGLMFDVVDSDGRPFDAQYARERMRWESLVEVTQMKGTSEIAPELAPTDEFAEYEVRRKLLIGTPVTPTEADYARTALMRGLGFQNSLGVNPYKFGLIGATDGHVGITSVEENNFFGKIASDSKLSQHVPVPGQRAVIFPAWEMSAAGLTGVWADENTRDSIFAAMKRKEVYATTGTRISLRMFGGFSFKDSDARATDLAAVGYKKGVPMGSDLTAAPRGKAPSLLILAVKDPAGANLDRVQVVKGWLDDKKQPQQKVYDVAWSGNRKIGADGKLPAVGNTVDVSTALWSNSIGAAQLSTVWTDPDFKADQEAFYYVRALEIPTPRHSLYDAVALGIDVSVTKEPATIQERAYSSPIWYTP